MTEHRKTLYALLALVIIFGLLFLFVRKVRSLRSDSAALFLRESRLRKSAETVPPQPTKPVITPGQAEFLALIRKALAELPKTTDVQRLGTEDVHHFPKQLMEQTKTLPQILQSLQTHPENIQEGVRFFRTCAQSREILLTVRARCLTHFRNWGRRAGVDVESELKTYPKQILQLSELAP